MAGSIKVENLTKIYNKKEVLHNISFCVKDGEFLSILGPSGCGKTTILRILIGIETPTTGEIYKDGQKITNFHPSKRNMGIVFQNYALFPNMTVLENIRYALQIKLKSKDKANKKAMELVKSLGLEEHIEKRPNELSGGQQQRVAIARTLALNPDIILFDEALSALDPENRLILKKEFKKIQRDYNITIIYITHDQEEAFSLSDRVMVMKDGNIEQIDTPNIIFNNPANEYVKKFVQEHLLEKISSIENCTKVDL